MPGVSRTGSYLDNRMQRCPCAKVLGVGGWLTYVSTPETCLSQRSHVRAHTGVVAGTATVSSSIEKRHKQPPPRAAISASPPDSEG